jgi:hypothetical protein
MSIIGTKQKEGELKQAGRSSQECLYRRTRRDVRGVRGVASKGGRKQD